MNVEPKHWAEETESYEFDGGVSGDESDNYIFLTADGLGGEEEEETLHLPFSQKYDM